MNQLTIGTRTSRLARWQSNHVIQLLQKAWPEISCHVTPFVTKGDKTLHRPLPQIGGKGLFTAELEQALRNGEIDLAVHSLKDLPVADAPGLTVGAIPDRAETCDGLVARNRYTLATLPAGARVGTSSLRRQAQILAVRPDLRVHSIRGNVETRIRKALEGDYDATILAAAGLQRLGLEDVVTEWLPPDVMLPAPGQGALAVQCRAGDEATLTLLAAIDNQFVRMTTTAERHFLQALGGGCSAPIAAYATGNEDGSLHLQGLIASPDGQNVIRVAGTGDEPKALAVRLAEQARQRGATAILASVAAKTAAPRPQPLHNRRVVITRARPQAPELARKLEELGAIPILFPTIQITAMPEPSNLDDAIRSLGRYDWVIFTSVNGVAVFWERMDALAADVTIFDGVKVAAIGPATGDALADRGVEPAFIPDEFVAERIAEGLGQVRGRSILLPRAELARKTLAELLSNRGAEVNEIATYRTLPVEPAAEAVAQLEDAHVLTFTSSSTVRNFVDLVGGPAVAQRLAAGAVVACIGPITADTAAAAGLEPDVVADEYTMDGLVAALVRYFATDPYIAR